VREKEWFQARMTLEREVEMLKTELQGHENKAKRWTEEWEQVNSVSICAQFPCFTVTRVQILTLLSSVAALQRVGDLRVRLGEDDESEGEEEEKEENPYSAANLEKRKTVRERGQRERDVDDGEEGGGGG
jgi:hypothetical protein